jgi:hypothetical protein
MDTVQVETNKKRQRCKTILTKFTNSKNKGKINKFSEGNNINYQGREIRLLQHLVLEDEITCTGPTNEWKGLQTLDGGWVREGN